MRQQHRILGQQEGPPPAVVCRCPVLGPPVDLQQHQAGKHSSAKEGYCCQVIRLIPKLSYHLRMRVCAMPSGVCMCVCDGAEWCVAINTTPLEVEKFSAAVPHQALWDTTRDLS